MRIDVRQSPEMLAVIYAMRSLDTAIAKMVRQHIKRVAAPEWTKALERRANTALERRVMVNTATVAVSNQNVRVTSANKGRKLSGGLNPKTHWHAIEFGADRNTPVKYRRKSPRGKTHTVTRHVARGLKDRKPKGYVFYPAGNEMVPRLGALAFQTVWRSIATALEGKKE